MTKTVEIKSCKNCGTQFEITDKDLEFYDKISPVFGGRKYSIPSPTLCPDCRQQRRLAWRNERKLYHRKSDLSGKQLISMYSPDKDMKVYGHEEWWSDQWDARSYGIDPEFNTSFFEQFRQLLITVPQFAMFQMNLDNADYCNIVANSKNSYLVFAGSNFENCFYGVSIERSQNIIDGLLIKDSQNCYESFMLTNCYNVFYSNNSSNCSDCYFITECENCKYCLFCDNLKNQEYCIRNKKVTKEEFDRELSHISYLEHEELKLRGLKFNEFESGHPKKFGNLINCESTSGNNLVNCNKIENGFDCYEVDSCKNIVFTNFEVVDAYDCSYTGHYVSNAYEGHLIIFNSSNVFFSNQISGSQFMFYSNNCHNCSNCFGCTGLRNQNYCILNKQYSKEDYEKIVPQIIEHMKKDGERGEFFPLNLSAFGYNETVAYEYFPMTKSEVESRGWTWSEYENQNGYNGDYYSPLSIEEYKDNEENKLDMLKGVLKCEATGKPFRIIKPELEFYIRHNIQIPQRCPDQRHLDRLARRNPRKLRERSCQCDNCAINNNSDKPIVFKTTYSPDRPEKVYCETCYNKEVYG